MSTSIEIKGDYSQKTEIFGKVLSHHTGTFDLTKQIGSTGWSQPVGPATLTEMIQNGNVVVSLSAFGQSIQLFNQGVDGHNNFKIELDTGNFVMGTVTVSNS